MDQKKAPAIVVNDLSHEYLTIERGSGIKDILNDLFARKTKKVHSLRGISFEVAPGEILGLLGPNGAGKTTLLKVLSGLLKPSSGSVKVLDHTPFDKKNEFLEKIGFVYGQKSQLNWDLPPTDSFDFIRAVYRINQTVYRERLDRFVELLDFSEKLKTPVRKLSLGERMKAEIICSILHMPEVLFLDEPTIGLDIVTQKRIRGFIQDLAKENGTSVILTSHYMADIEALSDRLCLLQKGQIHYFGQVDELIRKHSAQKVIKITTQSSAAISEIKTLGFEFVDNQFEIHIDEDKADEFLKKLLSRHLQIDSLSFANESLENTIFNLFSKKEISEKASSLSESSLDPVQS